ncbi:MAG: hypothetical protein ACE5JI_14110 [Acidobacteriota bacterium]
MSRKSRIRERSGIHIEWVTIRRRSAYLFVAVVAGLVGAGAGTYWWYHIQRQARAAAVQPKQVVGNRAHFIELSGTVKVRKAGSYEWIDANTSIPLERNDTVRTVGRSTARVRFLDGTEYLVKHDTILVIEEVHEDPRTNVRRVAVKLTAGRVNLQTPRRNVAGSRSELATPTTEASFEEMTHANVEYNTSSRVSAFTVFRGSTRLKSGGKEVKLVANQAVDVLGDSRFSNITELPGIPSIESPANLSVVPPQKTIELKWKGVKQARRYRVVLDRSPNFSDPLLDNRVRELSVLVQNLVAGTYYWRVSAIDANNQEGGPSDFAKFTITSRVAAAGPPELLVSQPRVSIDGVVTVAGKTDPVAVVTIDDTRVSVKPDGTFRHYFTLKRAGRHPIVVKAHKRSGGTAQKIVYADIGSD